jgi:hypothetical protein
MLLYATVEHDGTDMQVIYAKFLMKKKLQQTG